MNVENVTGQTQDAGFQVGVRKTVPGKFQDIWDFLFSDRGLSLWLGPIDPDDLVIRKEFSLGNSVTVKITVFEPYSHLRMSWKKNDWPNSSRLQLRVMASGDEKSVIAFHQEMLTGPEQREEMKDYWDNILSRLGELVP
ncbi:MAG: ATPase [Bacteroidetes bacterium]|nr:MAG: ATPase [Bacteroidota bacterium]